MGVYDRLNAAAGWREFRVRGALPAAFLNRCAQSKLALLCAEAEDAFTLRVNLRSRDAKRAERIARRSGCTLEPLRSGGTAVLGARLRRRGLAAVCLLLVLALLARSRLFLWEIEVSGCETLSEGRVLDALSDCGVGIGSFWPAFTSDNLRSELMARLPELGWITVNVYGSRAEVLVRERVPKPAIWNAKEPVDLVAKHAGFVTKVTALNGTAAVKPGQAVEEGDLLIAGRTDSAFGGTRTVHAAGEVWAETRRVLCAETPLVRAGRGETAYRRSRWALLLGGRRWNLYRAGGPPAGDAAVERREWSVSIPGLFTLPITLLRETETLRAEAPLRLDANEARRAMESELHARLLRELGAGGSVREERFTCTETDGVLRVRLEALCTENLAAERPADVG